MDYDPLVDLYEQQYTNYRDDIAFYGRLAEQLGAVALLELGAGTGRVSVPLAKRGLHVTGLERSKAMLERARKRAEDEGVEINWLNADMREMSLGQCFPLIIAPFNALMHLYTLRDQDAALESIRTHLEPGGIFAFDLYQPRFGPERVLRHEGETFIQQNGSRTDVTLWQNIDRVAQLATTHYFVDTIALDGTLTRQALELRQRYYTRFELERWLGAFGFQPRFSGDFDGSTLQETSPHIVVTAKRG